MEIEYFDPISQPKKLRSAEEMRKLPDGEKLKLEAADNSVRKNEEYTKE